MLRRHGLGGRPEPTRRGLRGMKARCARGTGRASGAAWPVDWTAAGMGGGMGRDGLTIHCGPVAKEAEEERLQAHSPRPEHTAPGGSEPGRHPPAGHTDRLLPCRTPNRDRCGRTSSSHPACTCAPGMAARNVTSSRDRNAAGRPCAESSRFEEGVRDDRTRRGKRCGFPVGAALRSLQGPRRCHSRSAPSAVLRPHLSRAGEGVPDPRASLGGSKSHCGSASSGPEGSREAASQDVLLPGK